MDKAGELQDFLKNAECFAELDEASLALLIKKMKPAAFQAGDTICSEGEPGDWMFVVKSGEVSVLKRVESGAEVEIATLSTGDVGGMMSLFQKTPRTATLGACGRVELWTLDHTTFQHVLETNNALAMKVLEYMSQTLHRESQLLAKLQSAGEDPRFSVAVFDSKPYMKQVLLEQSRERFAFRFFDHHLTVDTIASAIGFKVICIFVNDTADAAVVERLGELGVEMIALRCAGYNNVDLNACAKHGISVARVPAYSPNSVAEFAVAMIMSLNRRIYRAHARVREGNFSLDGLVGFELNGKTAGIVGTGRIGKCAVDILLGFGCRILAYDPYPDPDLAKTSRVNYVELDTLFDESDIISLHLPLFPATKHLINADAIAKMKRGVMFINTSRGGLVDTAALIDGLKTGHIGSAGLDVYEEEGDYFFEDYSDTVIADDILARLMTFNNVVVTSHQGFLTGEALTNIADTTLDNIEEFVQGRRGKELTNHVGLD